MKKPENPLDVLFREVMKDHSMVPSGAARKAFLQDAALLTAKRKNNRKGLIMLSVIAFLAISGIATWMIVNYEQEPVGSLGLNSAPGAVTTASSPPPPGSGNITRDVQERQPLTAQPAEIMESGTVNPLNSAPEIQSVAAIPSKEPLVDQQPAAINQSDVLPIDTPIEEPAGALAVAPNSASQATSSSTETEVNKRFNTISEIPPDTLSVQKDSLPEGEVKKHASGIPGRRSHKAMLPSIGVQYSPEIMFNTLEGEKLVHHFGVEGIFHFGPFSIRTGAGLSLATGTNELSIEYNEYLGTYNKLDSMDFTWDNTIYKYMPTYYLSQKDVYDSLLKYDNHRIEKRYSYLRIPLIFGYDVVENGRWSAGLRAGPVMSVLLGTKQLSGGYDEGKNHIVHINDITPEQVSLNWQVMAGFNAGLRIDERFRFELEPSVSYYFNSVFEKPGTFAKPWSAGIRAAFLIQL